MTTFLIKNDGVLLSVAEAANKKQAIIDYAIPNRVNPFVLTAEELRSPELKELFVKETVRDHLKKEFPKHTKYDLKGVVDEITQDTQLWSMIDSLMKSYVLTYMGKKSGKGLVIDERI